MLSHTGEKPFICKQCNYLFVYLHIRHPGTSFLRSSYNYIFKNIAYVIVYVWPSRTWDEILLPFQKGLFFPLGDIRLFLPTRIRICAYAHHPTWIRHGRIRMAIPSIWGLSPCSMEWKHYFGTALNGTVFCQLTILRPQITKMAAYKLSKNDWVMPFFVIIRFTREKLLVTVSFDHPVAGPEKKE